MNASANRDRCDRGTRGALDLQRLHHEGELVHALGDELVELQVLEDVDAVDDEQI